MAKCVSNLMLSNQPLVSNATVWWCPEIYFNAFYDFIWQNSYI